MLFRSGNNYLKQLTFGARANPPVPICCATRDHEPRRGKGSALPIRLGLAATRLETSSFALCATADRSSFALCATEASRRYRLVPAAHGLLRRAGTRNAASAAHEKTRNHSDRPSWRRLAGTARRAVRRQRWITMTPWTSSTIRSFREAREAGVSCAAKAAFRVRRHGGTRRVLAEALRRPTKSMPGARSTAANRRQAIRHAAGFVVARSATPSTKFFEEPNFLMAPIASI